MSQDCVVESVSFLFSTSSPQQMVYSTSYDTQQVPTTQTMQNLESGWKTTSIMCQNNFLSNYNSGDDKALYKAPLFFFCPPRQLIHFLLIYLFPTSHYNYEGSAPIMVLQQREFHSAMGSWLWLLTSKSVQSFSSQCQDMWSKQFSFLTLKCKPKQNKEYHCSVCIKTRRHP